MIVLIITGALALAAFFFFLGMWVERSIAIARAEFSQWDPPCPPKQPAP